MELYGPYLTPDALTTVRRMQLLVYMNIFYQLWSITKECFLSMGSKIAASRMVTCRPTVNANLEETTLNECNHTSSDEEEVI